MTVGCVQSRADCCQPITGQQSETDQWEGGSKSAAWKDDKKEIGIGGNCAMVIPILQPKCSEIPRTLAKLGLYLLPV